MLSAASKRWIGPLATLGAMLLIDVLMHGPVKAPALVTTSAYLLCLALVILSAALGGMPAALASSAIISFYVLRLGANEKTGPLDLSPQAFTGVGIVAILAVGIALMARLFQRKQERLAEALQKKNTQLDASQRILAQAEEVAEFGSWELDVATGETHWSAGMYRVLGIPMQEGAAKVELYWAAIPAAERDAARARFAALTSDPTPIDLEQRILRPDSSTAWVRVRGELLTDDAGKPVRVVGSMQDITRQKETTEALEHARLEAESAAMAKAEFLANMSHEIRTPMNAVIGMTSLMLDTELDERQRDYLGTIRSSGEHLLTIINDILDFSKIESGHLEVDRHVFEPERLIEEAMDLSAPGIGARDIDLLYDTSPEVPRRVVGDAGRVRQVLVNLLSNAVKFTKQGEIVVTLTSELAANDRVRLMFTVRDTGIGIPPDRLDRLFKAFSQADTSTTREFGGTGLGLAISKRLVELMGGKISIESREGQGTTFRFDIVAESSPGGLDDVADHAEVLKGARLLVVDDNETNVRIVSLKAEAWGMAPRSTTKPLEALAWVERGDPFEVVVLDYHMPGMDGVELARRIRAQRPGRPPILLLASSASLVGAMDGLFAATLTKPLKMSALYNTLVQLVSGTDRPKRALAGAARTPAAVSPLRILLTEDNQVNQKVATRMLERLGYRADIAANGREAIDALQRQAYDVVLMDVQMPVMDGLEATREICARWKREERPRIIGLTAHALEEDERRCREAGMDDYLSKPIKMDALKAALERA